MTNMDNVSSPALMVNRNFLIVRKEKKTMIRTDLYILTDYHRVLENSD